MTTQDTFYDLDDIKLGKKKAEFSIQNEFLSQRLSMIPIHFEKKIIDDWNRDHYSFVIDEKNNSNEFMDITSKHIKVYINDVEYRDRDNIFPPYITPEKAKDFILITKLPPATTKFSPAIKVNLKASLGSGHQHISNNMNRLRM